MKPIDVERLLHWAYRDELVKGGDIVSSSFGIVIRLGQLGTVVDNDQFEHVGKLPPIFGEPHPDAKLIEREVKAALSRKTAGDPACERWDAAELVCAADPGFADARWLAGSHHRRVQGARSVFARQLLPVTVDAAGHRGACAG